MKKFKPIVMLTVLMAMFCLTSCKKEPEPNNNDNAALKQNDVAQNLGKRCYTCLVTHTEDDAVGITYDIFYNAQNNPDSISEYGSAGASDKMKVNYDNNGRLSNSYYPGSLFHADFKYWNHSDFPKAKYFYESDYLSHGQTDSLIASDSFKYNGHGEIIQIVYKNIWYPDSYTLNFSYNNKGNVTSITHIPDNAPSFTEYTATQYDNKQNFMNGNKWLKYLIVQTGFEPYYFLMMSKNNAVNWTWTYNPASPSYIFTSTFNYNSNGFANNVFLHTFDGYVYTDYTRTSTSTCDNGLRQSSPTLIKRFPLQKNNATRMPGSIFHFNK